MPLALTSYAHPRLSEHCKRCDGESVGQTTEADNWPSIPIILSKFALYTASPELQHSDNEGDLLSIGAAFSPTCMHYE